MGDGFDDSHVSSACLEIWLRAGGRGLADGVDEVRFNLPGAEFAREGCQDFLGSVGKSAAQLSSGKIEMEGLGGSEDFQFLAGRAWVNAGKAPLARNISGELHADLEDIRSIDVSTGTVGDPGFSLGVKFIDRPNPALQDFGENPERHDVVSAEVGPLTPMQRRGRIQPCGVPTAQKNLTDRTRIGQAAADEGIFREAMRGRAEHGDEIGFLPGGLEHALSGGEVGSHAGLAENVVVGGECGERDRFVEVRGGTDPNNVQIRRGDQLLPSGKNLCVRAEIGGEGSGTCGGGITDSSNAHAGHRDDGRSMA